MFGAFLLIVEIHSPSYVEIHLIDSVYSANEKKNKKQKKEAELSGAHLSTGSN